ncbi:MAG: hypothetical protein U0528_00565 [Anaerolineae bacterium]
MDGTDLVMVQANPEHIEKVRQEVMRFRELLNIMRLRLDEGERAYDNLFAKRSAEEKSTLKEKDLQWRVAEQLIADDEETLLRDAALHMRFHARDLERAFEELYNISITPPLDDDDEL